MPPYFAFHRKNVCSAMSCLRHRSRAGTPVWAPCNTRMICSAVWRFLNRAFPPETLTFHVVQIRRGKTPTLKLNRVD